MTGFRVQPEWITKYADVIRAQSGHAEKPTTMQTNIWP
jgi:hypothetical protein